MTNTYVATEVVTYLQTIVDVSVSPPPFSDDVNKKVQRSPDPIAVDMYMHVLAGVAAQPARDPSWPLHSHRDGFGGFLWKLSRIGERLSPTKSIRKGRNEFLFLMGEGGSFWEDYAYMATFFLGPIDDNHER
eukprot:scaffold6846_cov107-Cylindrotheca_fusiformis.AAC.4